ncbi:MAG: DUF3016 domain-containing protein [Thioalkalivibrio sp.]|nr:DUF3016 domain-containing protein [Thioalkalivibrio sp.]
MTGRCDTAMIPRVRRTRLALLFAVIVYLPAASAAADTTTVNIQWPDSRHVSCQGIQGLADMRTSRQLRREVGEAFRREASRVIPSGMQLEITMLDFCLAGDTETLHHAGYQGVRVVSRLYPPAMSLTYELRDQSGEVIISGEERLVDMNFMAAAHWLANPGDGLPL